ncbi:MAG: hypothetical protein IPM64_13650 [Phycisphaerales bacterium]|nr:hypothetical protein [Phycisphaerales bacterium]
MTALVGRLLNRTGVGGGAAARVPRVNLLPEPVRAALRTRARTRRWVAACAAAIALLSIAWTWLQRDEQERSALLVMIERARGRASDEAGRVTEVSRRVAAVSARAAVLSGLGRPHSTSAAIEPLATHLPAEAVLTGIRVEVRRPAASAVRPPEPAPRRSSAAGPRSAPTASTPAPPPAVPLDLRAAGVCRDSAALSQYVRALQQSGAYRTVELTRSTSTPMGEQRWISFELVCGR